MKVFTRWFSALATIVLLAGPAVAADAIATGKIKGIDSDSKEFVLTDNAGKDSTFKLGEDVVINRGGTESRSDLKTGDTVDVCYDKGVFTWTANYILVQEGDTEGCRLVHGTVRNYDAEKRQVTFTDDQAKDWSFPMGDAKVHLNRRAGKIGDLKIGDQALAIVETVGDTTTLKSLMIDRE